MKSLKLVMFILISLSVFATGLKDGRYWVEEKEYSRGWKSFTAITVQNGKVVSVKHDKINPKDEYVTEDKAYNANMKRGVGTNPIEFTKALESDFMAKQDIEKVDIVAGATANSNIFKDQMRFLLEKAKTGETGKHILN